MTAVLAAPQEDYDYNYYDYENSCNSRCPQKYQPVCAVNEYGDYKEFASYCRMVLYNCRNNQEQFFSGLCFTVKY
jgi:hypothetical protein